MEYDDLAIIDLEKAGTSAGREELAIQVRNAMTTQGFFYAINSGYSPKQVSRALTLAIYAIILIRKDGTHIQHSRHSVLWRKCGR